MKSGTMFLNLEDAVKIATREFDADEIIARQEFEQKCYIPCSDYEIGFYDGLAKARDKIEVIMNSRLYLLRGMLGVGRQVSWHG